MTKEILPLNDDLDPYSVEYDLVQKDIVDTDFVRCRRKVVQVLKDECLVKGLRTQYFLESGRATIADVHDELLGKILDALNGVLKLDLDRETFPRIEIEENSVVITRSKIRKRDLRRRPTLFFIDLLVVPLDSIGMTEVQVTRSEFFDVKKAPR